MSSLMQLHDLKHQIIHPYRRVGSSTRAGWSPMRSIQSWGLRGDTAAFYARSASCDQNMCLLDRHPFSSEDCESSCDAIETSILSLVTSLEIKYFGPLCIEDIGEVIISSRFIIIEKVTMGHSRFERYGRSCWKLLNLFKCISYDSLTSPTKS